MTAARLIFQGPADSRPDDLRGEDAVLAAGDVLPARWHRSPPWNPRLGFERVIIGSHPSRADVRLEGEGIEPEHVRIYFSRDDDEIIDFRPLEASTTRVDGRLLERLEIVRMRGGETVELGPWKFRFELEPARPGVGKNAGGGDADVHD